MYLILYLLRVINYVIILDESSLIDYIFLSRDVSLPLSILKIIKKNKYSFSKIVNFSESKFKSLLLSMKNNYKVSIRNIEEKVIHFKEKNNKDTFNRINRDLRICKNNDIKCLSYFDKEFPALLRNIKQQPIKFIFMKGEIKPEDHKAVAIIGTRNPTNYGKKMAAAIAKRFVELGFTIVSGFARGIDTIAMENALESGGRVIGVIASGILNLYPKENIRLLDKLVQNGAIISERFPKKSVNKTALKIRNRITSGLGLGNIVVEGNQFSGTRWQLKFGNQQNKPAIAVEPIEDCEQAFVPNLILKDGGARISDVEDVDYIAEMLLNEYKERKEKREVKNKKASQTNLLKY